MPSVKMPQADFEHTEQAQSRKNIERTDFRAIEISVKLAKMGAKFVEVLYLYWSTGR